uniref:Uncharacterized protein n=1 Tax=Caenorhabditis japonica TaxID=281687 RepID=A0A8R1EDQ6_CAEJA
MTEIGRLGYPNAKQDHATRSGTRHHAENEWLCGASERKAGTTRQLVYHETRMLPLRGGAETGERATCNCSLEDARPPDQRPKPQETKGEIVWKQATYTATWLLESKQPPPLSEDESILPRNTRLKLARLKAEKSLLLEKYKAKVENRPVENCIKCSDDERDLKHFLKCYTAKPLPMSKLWKDPVAAATSLGLAFTPFNPGGDADP